MKSSLIFLFFLLTLLPASAIDSEAKGNKLYINGMHVLTLQTSLGGLKPEARVQAMAKQLRQTSKVSSIKAVKVGARHRIVLNGNAFLTITAEEGRKNDSLVPDLAALWLQRIRQSILLPPIKVVEPTAILSLGDRQKLGLIGTSFEKARIVSSDEEIAVVEKRADGVYVFGKNFGNANISISYGDLFDSISVSVIPRAADLPQKLTAEVTGNPVTITTVEGAIMTALQTQLRIYPDAEIAIGKIQATHVRPAQSKTFSVPIKVYGDGLLTANGNVSVEVKNVGLKHQPEGELWYCNNPESVRGPGNLFSAVLSNGQASRLLYHHINESSSTLMFKVELINFSSEEARIVLIPGDSPPDKNPVHAGINAADQFVRAWMFGSGEVVTIPPNTSLPISLRKLAPTQTTSGLCYIRLLEGDCSEVLVQAEAHGLYLPDARWSAALHSSTPWRLVGFPRAEQSNGVRLLSEHVYPNPFKNEEIVYQVGGRYGFARIGQSPLRTADDRQTLFGNFGVMYNIDALVENPTQDSSDLEIVFEASAGYSGGLFILNGEFVRTPLLQPKEEKQLLKFTMQPGQSRRFKIMTMPLSGGSYPATLTIRPINDHRVLSGL